MSQKVDYVSFIGRFQPMHNGHIDVFNEAFLIAEKGVIIFIGSVNGPRMPKNPFTYEQRKEVITKTLNDMGYTNFVIRPLKDYRYSNTAWIESVQEQVSQIIEPGDVHKLIGYKKDDSSSYIDWFPQWGQPIEVEVAVDEFTLNATDIRQILFENKHTSFLKGVMPTSALDFIDEFRDTTEFQRLKREYEKNERYRKMWANSPFPPTFVTVDAVVNCAGHILLIRRGEGDRGAGQWAIPGGFLDQKERIVDGAIRELKEEADIDISERALKGLIRASEVFDAPNRDTVGRCITHAFYFVVDTYKGKLPKIRAAGVTEDEIADAKWVPIAEIDEDVMYADHYDIIMKFLGMVK
jgi:bifunctional NMN adenylyltransferase/nudix hydrolase